jgi:hypothetical protein
MIRNLATQDVACLVFHSFMLVRVWAAPDSADATMARRFALTLLTVTVSTLLLCRGEVLGKSRLRSYVYRIGLFAPTVLSYFEMAFLLPALEPVMLDGTLRGIDEMVLGTTPSMWFNQFNTPPVVEWFAFFYYSYFYLMAAMLIPALFFDKGARLREVMYGAMTVATLGHVIYTFVPGLGPVASMEFPEPIHGGFFWEQVLITVETAGSKMDIFPSLHTAYPIFYALHAFGWRKTKPFTWAWPIITFFALNMMIATMFLRWHWGIDIVAGLLLAVIARLVALTTSRFEHGRGRGDDDRQPVWEPITPAD